MKWQSTFEAYPNAKQLYVVEDQPFLTENEANSYAASVKKEVSVIQRVEDKKAKGKKNEETPVAPVPPVAEGDE